jgi:hypothetical protein
LFFYIVPVLAIIFAFFLTRFIYDSVFKPQSPSSTKKGEKISGEIIGQSIMPASSTQEGKQISCKIIGQSMLYGAMGAITPYILAFSLADRISSGVSEGVGILGTLACLPTIFIGAFLGGLSVWLVLRLEKPRRIFLKIENSADSRWIFLVGFLGGFLAGPILGLLAVLAAASFGVL